MVPRGLRPRLAQRLRGPAVAGIGWRGIMLVGQTKPLRHGSGIARARNQVDVGARNEGTGYGIDPFQVSIRDPVK